MSSKIDTIQSEVTTTFDPSGMDRAIAKEREYAGAVGKSDAAMASSAGASGQLGGSLSATGGKAAIAKAGVVVLSAAILGGAAALASFTGEAARYDSAIAEVATIAPSVAKDMAGFKEEVLGVSTALGQDAVVATKALYDAVSSGIPADNSISFLETAGKAAIAGVTDISTATSALTVAINSYNLKAEDAGKVSDILFKGVQYGVMTFGEIGSSIGQVTGLASSMNIGLADTVGAIAQVTTKGFSASEAVTAVRSSMVALQKPSKELEGAFKQLGVATGEELLQKFGGYQGAMEALRGVVDENGTSFAAMFGRVEAANAALALTGPNAEGARMILGQVADSAGATEAAYAIMAERVDQKTKVLGASWEAAKIAIGNAFLPVVSDLLDIGTPLVKWLGDAAKAIGPMVQGFTELPGPVKAVAYGLGALAIGGSAAVIGIVGLAAMFGPLIASMGGTSAALVTLQGAMASGGAMAASFGAAVSAAFLPITAIVVGVGVAWKSVSDWNAELDKQAVVATKAGGSLADYTSSVGKAREEVGLLGQIGDILTRPLFVQNEATLKASDNYLKMGLGMSDAAAKSAAFQQTYSQLKSDLMAGNVSVEDYNAKLTAAASAASIAAGEGRFLTESQRAQAEAFASSTTSLLPRNDAIRAAFEADANYTAMVKDLAENVATGNVGQAEAEKTILAYVSARQAATEADAAAAGQAGASNDAYKQYSDTLISMMGGAAIGFDPNAQLDPGDEGDKAKLDAIAKANESAGQAEQQHFSTMLQKRQEFNSQYAALVEQGKGEEAAKLQAGYSQELGMQQEHLAQLAINHVNSMLQLNQISEEQAKLIYGSLVSAFPDAQIFDASTAAYMNFSAILGDALAGDKEAAIGLGQAIATVPQSLDEAQAAADTYSQGAVAAFEAARGASADHAAGVATDDALVVSSGSARRDAQLAALGEEIGVRQQAADGATSAAGQIGAADTTVSAGQSARTGVVTASLGEEVATHTAAAGQIGSASTTTAGHMQAVGQAGTQMGSQAALGAGQVTSSMAGIGSSVASAANTATSSISGMASKAQSDFSSLKTASEGAVSGNAAVAQSFDTLARSASSVGGVNVQALQGAQRAAEDHGQAAVGSAEDVQRAQADEQTSVEDLTAAFAKLPKELTTTYKLSGVREAIADLEELRALQGQTGGASGGGGGSGGSPPGPRGRTGPVSIVGPGAVQAIGGSVSAIGGDPSILASARTSGAAIASAMGDSLLEALRTRNEDLRAAVDRLLDLKEAAPNWRASWDELYGFLFTAPASEEGSISWFLASGVNIAPGFDDRGAIASLKAMQAEYSRLAAIVADETALEFDRAHAAEEQERLWKKASETIRDLEDRRYEYTSDLIKKEQAEEKARHAGTIGQIGTEDQAARDAEDSRYEKAMDLLEQRETAEKSRHDNVLDRHSIEAERVADLKEREADYARTLQEYERELQRILKEQEAAFKERQTQRRDDETSLFDQVKELLDQEFEKREDAHDAILSRIQSQEDAEGRRHEAAVSGFEAEEAVIKKGLDARDSAIDDMQQHVKDLKFEWDLEGDERLLKDLQDELRGLQDEAKRVQDVFKDLGTSGGDPREERKAAIKASRERISLRTEEQKALFKKGLEDGEFTNQRDQRLAQRLMDGAAVRASDAKRLMALLGTAAGGADEARMAALQTEITALQERLKGRKEILEDLEYQIGREQYLADKEKDAAQLRLDEIGGRKRAEDERNKAALRGLSEQEARENERLASEKRNFDEARDRAAKLHKDKLKQIDEEYALQMMRLGMTDAQIKAALEEQHERAHKIAEEAMKQYEELTAFVESGGPSRAAVGGVVVPPGGGPLPPGTPPPGPPPLRPDQTGPALMTPEQAQGFAADVSEGIAGLIRTMSEAGVGPSRSSGAAAPVEITIASVEAQTALIRQLSLVVPITFPDGSVEKLFRTSTGAMNEYGRMAPTV